MRYSLAQLLANPFAWMTYINAEGCWCGGRLRFERSFALCTATCED